MESQQIVDYIAQHLGAGHTEASLRAHLAQYGWSQSAADDAFARYYQTGHTQELELTPAAKRLKRRAKRTLMRRIKLGIAGALVIIVAAVGVHIWQDNFAAHPTAPPLPPVTHSQRQSIDANNLGGAVGQYVFANGGTPTSVSISPDGNLVLCGAICDPATSEVVPLSVYKAADVKFETYISGIAVADPQLMYLVAGANCTGAAGAINQSKNPKAMAILYAVQSKGSALTQRCVTL